MKQIKNLSLLLLVAVSAVALNGCKKDDNNDREKFFGTYNVVEACSISGNVNYQITISSSASADDAIIINNFGNFNNVAVTGKVSGNNLTIPNQTLNVGGISLIINSGSGSISGNLLTITYAYSIGTDSESCTMTCNKI